MSGPSIFILGEIIRYELGGFVPYDGAFTYQFHSESDGQQKFWLLSEKGDPETWRDLFATVAP